MLSNVSFNPEHDQKQQQEQQQKETNQLPVAHNYPIQMSDRRPLTSSSLSFVESSNHGHAAPMRTPPQQEQQPSPHNDSMVMSENGSSSDIGSEEYIKILCEFYYHYSAEHGKPAITIDQTEMNGDGPVEGHPFELPSSSSPVSRQDLSLSSSSSSSDGGTINLTSSDTATTYTVLVEPISRDGHRDRSKSRGIRTRRHMRPRDEGDETENTTPSEKESKGVSGSGELNEMDSVTERLLQTNMNIIPTTAAAAAARSTGQQSVPTTLLGDKGDNAETSSSSVEVTQDGEDNDVKAGDGVDPKLKEGQLNSTYWSKTPDIFLMYLERRNVNRGESPKGIEAIFQKLFEPFADYETIASAVPDGTTDFELFFGVSERHMRWFCSKLGGNNTRVTVHNFNDQGGGGGSNKDGGLTEAARVSTGRNSSEWSGGA